MNNKDRSKSKIQKTSMFEANYQMLRTSIKNESSSFDLVLKLSIDK